MNLGIRPFTPYQQRSITPQKAAPQAKIGFGSADNKNRLENLLKECETAPGVTTEELRAMARAEFEKSGRATIAAVAKRTPPAGELGETNREFLRAVDEAAAQAALAQGNGPEGYENAVQSAQAVYGAGAEKLRENAEMWHTVSQRHSDQGKRVHANTQFEHAVRDAKILQHNAGEVEKYRGGDVEGLAVGIGTLASWESPNRNREPEIFDEHRRMEQNRDDQVQYLIATLAEARANGMSPEEADRYALERGYEFHNKQQDELKNKKG